MAKRKLTQRQRERIRAIQDARLARAERRAAVQAAEQVQSGLGPEQAGLVITNFGKTLVVEDASGNLQRCVPRQNLATPVAGDRVIWQASGENEGVVVALKERRSLLARPDATGGSKPVAANIDQIIVVLAPRPEPSEDLIDRYLVAAETFGIHPFILVNKVDLLDEQGRSAMQTRLSGYTKIGYETLFASSREHHGLDSLIDMLRHKTSVLVGQSGVGKSSLVKALLPDREIRIGALSAATGRGTHTTTATTLYHLPTGGELIDSPGVWDFGLWHIDADEVAAGFVEFRPYLGLCKFSDCSHSVEPGCAIKGAVERGAIEERRLASYHRIMAAVRTAADETK